MLSVKGWANIYKEKGSVMDYSIFLYDRFKVAEGQNELGIELAKAPKRVTKQAIWLELELEEK